MPLFSGFINSAHLWIALTDRSAIQISWDRRYGWLPSTANCPSVKLEHMRLTWFSAPKHWYLCCLPLFACILPSTSPKSNQSILAFYAFESISVPPVTLCGPWTKTSFTPLFKSCSSARIVFVIASYLYSMLFIVSVSALGTLLLLCGRVCS